MKKKTTIVLMSAFLLLSAFSCGGGNRANSTSEQDGKAVVNVPQLDMDSTYLYVKNQVNFGPRVSNTKEHVACGNYLASQSEAFGAQVTNQYTDSIVHDGTLLRARDIIGSYKPESKKRIALFAHWDTRPWTDNDPDEKNHETPILGANGGASGVGASLEAARLVNQQQPELGIDIIPLDTEDYGAPQFYTGKHKEEFWHLGSQYWECNPHVQRYNVRLGILFDMVGGEDSAFMKEGYSGEFVPDINKRIWKAAKKAGYGKTFMDGNGGSVTDDHLFIDRLARIRTVDIIPYNQEGDLTPTWHTVNDNMECTDKDTLKAVGQTVLEATYNEKQQN